jgi:hypothetical protein
LASVNPDGVPKLMISRECENLIQELQDAVYDELDYERIAKSCPDHAIDDLGLFLIFYSDDICPLGHDVIIADNRSKLQRMLDAEEEYLDNIAEEEELYIANGFDLW